MKNGGKAYSKHLNKIQSHYFNGTHFLLDEYAAEAAEKIKNFIN
jgi:surfactin synthase thioesterase subunit